MNTTPQPAAAETKVSPAITSNSTALDQWRGLALVLVLISHGFYFTGRVYGIGRVGVNLFFFISGVLVFKSLTSHRDATGWERTRHFWVRRLRRLYPAMIAYVLVMVPIVYVLRNVPGAVTASMSDYLKSAPFALTYAINYWPESSAWSLGHLWSLACETQFYMLAPVIFLLGGKTFAQRNLVWGAWLLALAAWGFIGGTLYPDYKYHFEIAVWPMMLGFICEYRKDVFQKIPAKWFGGIIVAGIMAFLVMTAIMLCGYAMKYFVIAIGTFAFIPCFLAYVGSRTLGGPLGRTMTWLGERTYSIYLWQEPLTICNYLPTVLHPLGAVVATVVGGVWFRFFERPFLSTKRQQVAKVSEFSKKKKIGPPLVWGAGILLVLAIVLGFAAREQYASALAMKVFPQDKAPLQLNAAGSGPILLLGDSRVAAWNCSDIAGQRVINGGFPGITSAQLAGGCDRILKDTHPKIVVVQVGINDLKLIGVRPQWREMIVSNCVSNILSIVDSSKQAGAHVMVTAIWPAGRPGLMRRFVWNEEVNAAVAETNLRLQHALVGESNAALVDLFGEMTKGLPDSEVENLYADTLHLKPGAYAQLTPWLAKELPTGM
jgi:peptidoglycan/LPS O-acetylase OafA/YrhL/lysophospholipase L1-like esterase